MIYLDSAATTLQKPPSVARSMAWAVGWLASPGRGGHLPAQRAAKVAFACRQAAAELFGVDNPERVIFTASATHGLNIAIRSLVAPGAKVLISGWEHNAVTRPLHRLGAEVAVAQAPLFDGQAQLEAFARGLEQRPAAVICTHVSNVFGAILPVGDLAELCRDRGVPLIVDASQSAGCLPVEQDKWGAAFVAMPGHKGLYGPQGIGLLLCGGEKWVPLLEGGTGSSSALQTMPDFLPDGLEAGTHNMPGIAGLLAGLRYVAGRGTGAILRKERELLAQAVRGLETLPNLTLFAAPAGERQGGVLSFQVKGMDCEEVGERLSRRGIALRAGLHCAPLAHSSAGTLGEGTVRASLSDFNTPAEVDRFVWEVGRLAGRQP